MRSSQKLNLSEDTKCGKKFNSKKAIENLTRVFTDPIVVHGLVKRGEIPECLRESIKTARMTALIGAYKEGKERYDLAPDEEALAYLMTASLTAPLDGNWAQIFLWLCKQYFSEIGVETPDFMDVELNGYQKDMLNKLKSWIKDRQDKYWKKMRRSEKEVKKKEIKVEELNDSQKELLSTLQRLLKELQEIQVNEEKL